MIEFSKDHSSAWMEMMSAYQVFRAKLFDWAHEPIKKQKVAAGAGLLGES